MTTPTPTPEPDLLPEDDGTAQVLVGRRTGKHWYRCVYNPWCWHLTKGRCGAPGEPFAELTWSQVWRQEEGFTIEPTSEATSEGAWSCGRCDQAAQGLSVTIPEHHPACLRRSAVARVADVLAGHQVASRGLTSKTPDECTCEERVMPAPADPLLADIDTRRARAFAAHQAEALAEAGLLPTDTEWGVRTDGRSAPRVQGLPQPGGLVRYGEGSEVRARRHMELYPQHTLVRREVCEWVEVPS